MNPFKVGDKVLCVESVPFDPKIVEGNSYIVTAVCTAKLVKEEL